MWRQISDGLEARSRSTQWSAIKIAAQGQPHSPRNRRPYLCSLFKRTVAIVALHQIHLASIEGGKCEIGTIPKCIQLDINRSRGIGKEQRVADMLPMSGLSGRRTDDVPQQRS